MAMKASEISELIKNKIENFEGMSTSLQMLEPL